MSSSRRGDVTVVTVEGSLAIGGGDEQLRRSFRDQVDAGARSIVLDLRGVTTVDSAGLGEIVACHKRAAAAGARIGLVIDPAGRIREFFRTAQLERVFEVFEDLDEAVASF